MCSELATMVPSAFYLQFFKVCHDSVYILRNFLNTMLQDKQIPAFPISHDPPSNIQEYVHLKNVISSFKHQTQCVPRAQAMNPSPLHDQTSAHAIHLPIPNILISRILLPLLLDRLIRMQTLWLPHPHLQLLTPRGIPLL